MSESDGGRVATLLGQNPFFQSLQDAVSVGPSSDEVFWFWCAAAVLAVLVGIGIRYATRRDAPRALQKTDYLTLFVDVLGLSEEDRRALARIAVAAKLEEPGVMLLSPRNLACAVAAATFDDPTHALRDQIDQLCTRMFGTPLPAL
jgi:hypothetical protein